ncbi:MAG: 50S ribosomal protein L3 N(5)-glutamine methyltransferase [Opitutaceae bacterium]|jgi:ribosomal protein L3 glutamine methyltransferase|nr:50S ribosomal protein L3 N(5)-glutamine methyltransferase [Opitutaceae bacterium]
MRAAGEKTPATAAGWRAFAARRWERAGAAAGQVAADLGDEALFLVLRGLGLPLDSPPEVLRRKLSAAENARLASLVERRAEGAPSAYLLKEAWLGGLRFHVDERVLIPRSYFTELIPGGLPLEPANVRRAADVCAGSACLAILMARHYRRARVDAVELSADALEVARLNVRRHRLTGRVALFRSDLFDAVPEAAYDLIVSNPPYEPSAVCDKLPREFQREPRMALDGGRDGLAIIRRLVAQAARRLAPEGVLAMEVGGLRNAMERGWPGVFHWLPTADGSDCVCLATSGALRRFHAASK